MSVSKLVQQAVEEVESIGAELPLVDYVDFLSEVVENLTSAYETALEDYNDNIET